MVRFLFGERTKGQMEAGLERQEAEIRKTTAKIMAADTEDREWILVEFRKWSQN